MKPERVRFMLYLRVLLKYLQRKGNPETYETLKLALHECASKSRQGVPGYESLTLAMQRLIPEIVPEKDLRKVHEYVNIFMKEHQKRQKQAFKTLDPNLAGR